MTDEGTRPASRRTALARVGLALSVATGMLLSPMGTARADQEVNTFATGSEPAQVSVTPDGTAAYVVNRDSGSMTRYDTTSGSTSTISAVGAQPAAVAVSPDGSTVAVADYANDDVRFYTNSATPTFEGAVGVDSEPNGLAFGPGGSDLYVSAFGADKVDVVTMASRTMTDSYAVNDGPVGVAASPDGKWVVVACETADAIDQITLASGTVDHGLIGGGPVAVAISPDSAFAYFAQRSADQIRVLNLAAHTMVTSAVPTGTAPSGIAVSSDGTLVYVADSGSGVQPGDIAVVDAAALARVRTVAVDGKYPTGLALSADGTRYYATLVGSNTTEALRAQPWGPRPTVSGSARVGATLTASAGAWAPAATTLDYQWYAGGTPVGGDAPTLRVPPSAVGRKVKVTVSGSVPGEQVYAATSTQSAAVAKAHFTHPRLRVTGKRKVGHRLTARPGRWSPAAALTYRWYIGKKRVRGATHKTWKVRAGARHHKVKVVVTAKKKGYVTATASRTTKKVH